tara:strand:- start:95 stop:334 length:240 start_codon:yes stop_codon:yes gene_type:complete
LSVIFVFICQPYIGKFISGVGFQGLLVASALAYSTVLLTGLWGMLFCNEILPPLAWLGVGLIVLGGFLSFKILPVAARR